MQVKRCTRGVEETRQFPPHTLVQVAFHYLPYDTNVVFDWICAVDITPQTDTCRFVLLAFMHIAMDGSTIHRARRHLSSSQCMTVIRLHRDGHLLVRSSIKTPKTQERMIHFLQFFVLFIKTTNQKDQHCASRNVSHDPTTTFASSNQLDVPA